MGLGAGTAHRAQAQHSHAEPRLGTQVPVGSLMGKVFSPSRENVDSTTTKPLGSSHLSQRDFVVTGSVKCPQLVRVNTSCSL